MALLIATLLAALPAPVTLSGVGGVTPGMTRAQVQHVWGTPVKLIPGSTGCDTANIKAGKMVGSAVFLNKRFHAVFFYEGASTPQGVSTGSTRAQLLKAYGSRLTSEPNELVPGIRNYYLAGAKYQLRFDVTKGRVTQLAFGDDAVHLPEECG
jgi:hypothetical protein